MSFRVMTYNILNGAAGREEYLLQVLRSVEPDVVVFQEVFTERLVHHLAQALQMTAFFGSGNAKRRVALLSRLPVHACHSHHPFPPIWRNVIEAEIEYHPGQRFRLFGIHPIANLGVLFEGLRRCEARYIIQRAKRYSAEPCLILGDFNAIAPDDKVALNAMPRWLRLIILAQGHRVYHFSIREYLAAGFTDCFRALHPADPGFTLPPPDPNSRLDYVFANEAMKAKLTACWVVREPAAVLQASDHYPVVAEFGL